MKKKIIIFLKTLFAIGAMGLLIYFLNFTEKGKKTIEFINFIKSKHGNSISLIILIALGVGVIFYLILKIRKLKKDQIRSENDNKVYSEFKLFLQSCQNLLSDICRL